MSNEQIKAEYKVKFQITLTTEQAEVIRRKTQPKTTRTVNFDKGRYIVSEKMNGFRI